MSDKPEPVTMRLCYSFVPLALINIPGVALGGGEDEDGDWHTGTPVWRDIYAATEAARIYLRKSCTETGGPQAICEVEADWERDTWDGTEPGRPIAADRDDAEYEGVRYLKPGLEVPMEALDPFIIVSRDGCQHADPSVETQVFVEEDDE